MGLSKDIIGADVKIGTNEAQASLTKLTKATSELTNSNDRLRMKQAQLVAAGKKNSEAYKNVTAEIKKNNTVIRQNKTDMNALQKTMGITSMSASQLQKKARELRNQLNGMVKSADPAQYKKLSKELDATNLQFQKVKAGGSGVGGMLSGLQGKLATMPGAFGQMTSGIITMGKAALAFLLTPVGAIMGAIAAIGMGAKALITNGLEFGKASSSLSAITGAVGDDLDFLKQKAIDISKDSAQSATNMLGAFEKIGSAMPALLKNGPLLAEVTKDAVALSEASGGTLAVTDAANAAAAAMNQFNIPLTESGRAVNALAAGSLEGSADITSLSESMRTSGAVLDGANVTLEESVALYEVLAQKQLKGSEAGTALKGVTLKLQAAGLGYASGQFNMRDALEEANTKIGEQSSALEKDALAQKLFGQEGITAGKILTNNISEFDRLTIAVTGTTTAYDQQKVQNDNVTISNKKLKESWKNLMLSIEDGNGILSKAWNWVLKDITKTLNNISSVIGFFKSKEAKQRNKEVQEQRNAEAAKRAELMETAKQLGLTVDEKISLTELENKVTEEQAKQQIETEKLLLKKQTEEEEKARKEREAKAKAARDKAFNILDINQRRELNELKKSQLKKGLSQAEFNATIEQKELEYLNRKQALHQKFGEDTTSIEATILNKQLKIAEDYAKNRINIDKLIKEAAEQYKKDMLDMDAELEKNLADESDKEATDALKEYEDLENLKNSFASDEVKRQMELNTELANLDLLSKNGMLLSHEQYEQMKAAITAKYAEERFATEQKYLSAANDVLGIFSNINEARKAVELKRAGDDAEKREEIERKFAQKQQKIAIGQALINGAMAQLKILAEVPKVDFGIMTAILMAAAGATTAAEIATISSQQFADGRYPVTGASDGRTYSAAWAGKPKTGIYNKPMLGLFSEKEPEGVIDGRTMKSLVWNYPNIWNGITTLASGGTPQFADGRYPGSTSSTTASTTAEPAQLQTDPAMLSVMQQNAALLQHLINNGVQSNINTNELFDAHAAKQKAINASKL